MTTKSTFIDQFITTLRDETLTPRADRARLRRDAGNTLAEARHPDVFWSKLPPGMKEYDVDWYFLVATLFPLAPDYRDDESWYNFGQSLRAMRPTEKELQKGLDRRVGRLLDADDDQLPFLLRQLVQQLAQKEVAVSWEQLLSDLTNWNHDKRFVQYNWARAYFKGEAPEADPTKTNQIETTQEN